MSVQYIVWVIGLVQILRFRRKARAAQRLELRRVRMRGDMTSRTTLP
jgi:hypothetical protein